MGVHGDDKLERADNRRAKQKAARGRRRSAVAGAQFRTVDYVPLLSAVIVATESGGALRLGVTRDGGAYAIGCYAGDEYATEYVKPNEDWESAWDEIVDAWFPTQREDYEGLKQWFRQQRSSAT